LLVFSGVEGQLQSLAESRRPDFVSATPHDLAEIGAQLIVLDVPRAGRFLLTILFRHQSEARLVAFAPVGSAPLP